MQIRSQSDAAPCHSCALGGRVGLMGRRKTAVYCVNAGPVIFYLGCDTRPQIKTETPTLELPAVCVMQAWPGLLVVVTGSLSNPGASLSVGDQQSGGSDCGWCHFLRK
jgi:hypothetical protein